MVSAARRACESRVHEAEEGSCMPETTASADAEEIRWLIAEYGRLLDLRDAAGFAALFTADGEWVGGTRYGVIAGHAALARFVSQGFGSTLPSVHLVGSTAIKLEGAEASAWSRWILLEEADGAVGSCWRHYDTGPAPHIGGLGFSAAKSAWTCRKAPRAIAQTLAFTPRPLPDPAFQIAVAAIDKQPDLR